MKADKNNGCQGAKGGFGRAQPYRNRNHVGNIFGLNADAGTAPLIFTARGRSSKPRLMPNHKVHRRTTTVAAVAAAAGLGVVAAVAVAGKLTPYCAGFTLTRVNT